MVRVPPRSGALAELLGPGDAGPALQSPESPAGWQTEAQRQSVGKAGPLAPCVSPGTVRSPEVEGSPQEGLGVAQLPPLSPSQEWGRAENSHP